MNLTDTIDCSGVGLCGNSSDGLSMLLAAEGNSITVHSISSNNVENFVILF
jgi:hypothetical protein